MEQNSNIDKMKGAQMKGTARSRPGRVRRRCLNCGGSFVTLSPFLRICPLCKESEEWQSGNDDVPFDQPSPFNHPGPFNQARRPANDNEQ